MQEHTKEASTVKWLNSTLEELQVLFGVILATGLIKLPEIDDYWREGALTGMRVQFMECHGFLRSFDKTISNSCYATFIQPIMNRIHLVTTLIKIIYSSLDSCLPSYQNLSIRCMLQSKNSIDEQKIGTKSRISFIQYMPKNLKSLVSRSGRYDSLCQVTV